MAGANAETILIADDHPMFRAALRVAVQRVAPAATIIEAGTLAEAADAARGAGPMALMLLDLRMPGAEGFSGVALLHAEQPETPILVVSAADPSAASGARAYGARGFLSKSADLDAIEQAVSAALSGTDAVAADLMPDPAVSGMADRIASLTPTQLRVLLGVLKGRLNKQIAHDLGISEATVKGHMTALMRKMDVQNRTQAVLAAQALQLEAAD